jgi:hypothetical protein
MRHVTVMWLSPRRNVLTYSLQHQPSHSLTSPSLYPEVLVFTIDIKWWPLIHVPGLYIGAGWNILLILGWQSSGSELVIRPVPVDISGVEKYDIQWSEHIDWYVKGVVSGPYRPRVTGNSNTIVIKRCTSATPAMMKRCTTLVNESDGKYGHAKLHPRVAERGPQRLKSHPISST